jgi:hypothetical protein
MPLKLALDVLNRQPYRVVGGRRHLVTDQMRTERPQAHPQVGLHLPPGRMLLKLEYGHRVRAVGQPPLQASYMLPDPPVLVVAQHQVV